MTAPSVALSAFTSAQGTTTLQLTGSSVFTAGHLVVMATMGADANVGLGLVTANLTVKASTFAGGTGGDWDARGIDAANARYTQLFSTRILTTTPGIQTLQATVTNWATGAGRRFAVLVLAPGSGVWSDASRRTRVYSGAVGSLTGTNPAFPWVGSGAPARAAFAIAALFRNGTTGLDIDWDGDTGTVGDGSSLLGGFAQIVGKGYDIGAAHRPDANAQSTVISPNGQQVACAVVYQPSFPADLSGKAPAAASAKAALKTAYADLSAKAPAAASAKATLRLARPLVAGFAPAVADAQADLHTQRRVDGFFGYF